MTEEPPRDPNNKRYVEQYDDSDFLAAIRDLDYPTVRDIADEVGCSRGAAWNRLNELQEQGVIDYQQVDRAHIWTIIE